jgi:chromosome segregation ATPase
MEERKKKLDDFKGDAKDKTKLEDAYFKAFIDYEDKSKKVNEAKQDKKAEEDAAKKQKEDSAKALKDAKTSQSKLQDALYKAREKLEEARFNTTSTAASLATLRADYDKAQAAFSDN